MNIWEQINANIHAVNSIARQLSRLQQETDTQECNGNYQNLVALLILQAGKPIEELTLGELAAITAAAQAEFAEMAA